MSDILVDTPVEGVARLTFNRPESMNTLTFAMYEELIEHLERIRYDHSIQVVIVAGSGRAFCAGHDLRAGGQPGWVDPELGRAQRNRAILANNHGSRSPSAWIRRSVTSSGVPEASTNLTRSCSSAAMMWNAASTLR